MRNALKYLILGLFGEDIQEQLEYQSIGFAGVLVLLVAPVPAEFSAYGNPWGV